MDDRAWPRGNKGPANAGPLLRESLGKFMQLKVLLMWAAPILGVVAVVFFSIVVLFVVSKQDAQNLISRAPVEFVQHNTAREQARVGLPARLKIPSIAVDAAIEHVGIAPDGSMAVPKGPDDVAWFNKGPRPGEPSSAVIAGHYGWKNNIPAAFDNLHKLRQGDKVYVEDEYGGTIGFVVRELRTYGENDDAWDVFNSSDGKAHLNLATCEGIWNKFSKSYSKRLVVFTDKVVE